ncbi:MAG: alpha-N-arabinofuranosidase [Spirochaetales bacterium]|nr:alpha-N-arabinofuranosidase [Spirochaetales bacterium]
MITYIVSPKKRKSQIDKNIYGHFSEHLGRCIYEGIFVGESSSIPNHYGMRDDVVNALKKIKIPVLRWPGGCFADEYHWKDGIGKKEDRKKMINTHWGGVVEDNSFGTHEFMKLCEILGCEPYINGNVGSGTVQEMAEWVEYISFGGMSPMSNLRKENGQENPWKIKYWGIGNENWGCGGNMRVEYYSDLYRQFATYVRNFDGNKIFKIACGPSDANYNWTKVLMENAGNLTDGITLHYYTFTNGWNDKGFALVMNESDFYSTLQKTLVMDELVTKHSAIMDTYDPEKRVALIVDEWGTWFDVEPGTNPGFLYQQNTMRDALVAGINLNIFNKHSDRVRMANIAQMVNVLQSVILTEGEKMILTPTYHVFEMYSAHQDATLVESFIDSGTTGTKDIVVPDVTESASVDALGNITMTFCNLDIHNEKEIETTLLDFNSTDITGEVLTGVMDAHNTFAKPTTVEKSRLKTIKKTKTGFLVTLPPCSIVKVVAKA